MPSFEIGRQPCQNFTPEKSDYGMTNRHFCPDCGDADERGNRSFCVNCHTDHHRGGWETCCRQPNP